MKLLKVSQVVDKLNMSRGKIYKMIKKGIIPSVNIDGSIRIPEHLLNQMIYRKIEGKTSIKIENNNTLSGGKTKRRN